MLLGLVNHLRREQQFLDMVARRLRAQLTQVQVEESALKKIAASADQFDDTGASGDEEAAETPKRRPDVALHAPVAKQPRLWSQADSIQDLLDDLDTPDDELPHSQPPSQAFAATAEDQECAEEDKMEENIDDDDDIEPAGEISTDAGVELAESILQRLASAREQFTQSDDEDDLDDMTTEGSA